MTSVKEHIWISTTNGLRIVYRKTMEARQQNMTDKRFTSLFFDPKDENIYMGGADGFGISLTQAGSIVSLFAFAYGLGTPFLAAYVGKYNRFRITMLGISLFALCYLICAIATNYMVFLVFRILTAVVSGTVVSISMTYAEDVASIPEHIPGVIAGVFSGFSIASVIGVPIASTITHVFGWRATFITIFVATLALLALLFMKLPRQNRLKAGSILEQFKLFLDKRISIGCAIVFLAGASTYCFYTYLTPIFQQ